MGPFSRFLLTVHLSGIPRPSRMTQSPNPSAIPKANGSTDPAWTVVAVRKPTAPNDRAPIRNRMMPLPRRHGKRAANRNARSAIPTANRSESDKNPKPVKMTVRRTGKEVGRGDARGGDPRNRKAGSSPRMNPQPLLPTLVPNLMDLRNAKVPDVLLRQD